MDAPREYPQRLCSERTCRPAQVVKSHRLLRVSSSLLTGCASTERMGDAAARMQLRHPGDVEQRYIHSNGPQERRPMSSLSLALRIALAAAIVLNAVPC